MALKVTQLKSNIGCKPKQRGTLRALGLRGIGRTNTPAGPSRDPWHDRPGPAPRVGRGGRRLMGIRIHDLEPADGSNKRGKRKARYRRQGRQDRRRTKGQRAATRFRWVSRAVRCP